MTYAYLRVSSDDQDVMSQRIGVVEFLEKNRLKCDRWYVDEGVSGGVDWRKRKVARMVGDAKAGDVLVFAEISRIGRKLVDVLEVIKRCSEKGVKIYTVKDRYTLEDSIQSKVLVTVMGLAAEIERDLIRQRTKEGLRRAREAGKTLGRPCGARTREDLRQLFPKAGLIRELFKSGSSLCEVAKVCRCHRNTVARFVGEFMPDVQELRRARAASRFERDARGRITGKVGNEMRPKMEKAEAAS